MWRERGCPSLPIKGRRELPLVFSLEEKVGGLFSFPQKERGKGRRMCFCKNEAEGERVEGGRFWEDHFLIFQNFQNFKNF